MKTKIHILSVALLACCFFTQTGCIHKPVRLDLDTYMLKPDAYADQDVIITATIPDVLARYELYKDKTIEVTAPVDYYSSYGFWTWHMMLEDNGKQLRCYTHYYRLEPGRDAINLLQRALSKKNPVTATGILRKDGIDLQRIESNGETAIPSFKPPRPYWGLWPYY